MPDARYWGALLVLALAGLAVRVVRRGPLLRGRPVVMGRADALVALLALLGLGFHCAAMFFPSVVAAVPATEGAAEAVRALAAASQVAYWVPAGLLLLALRRAWPPLLVAEAGVLLAVGATMFWDVGLLVHLVALAASVAVTVAVMTSITVPVARQPAV